MRGEHKFAWIKSRRLEGSSPHARGALKKGEVELVAGGIIPACAGSTLHDQRVWSTFSPNTFTFCKL